jgi:integrase/recombinase XerD
MTTTTSSASTAIAVAGPVFTGPEQLALAGFLAGYTGLTREAYALDLRQYASWCQQRHVRLFQARRADIECFARDLEAHGRARATITRRLCTIAGFYKYAVEEDLLDQSPAVHVRRPRLDYESHATGLDRNELGAMLVAGGLGTASEHADLATGAQRPSGLGGHRCRHRGPRRRTWHRTLTITRKGGKVATIPLAPRTARAIDLAIGERSHGPIFLAADGHRLDRHGAGRMVRRVARRDHQAGRTAHAVACLYHCGAGRWGLAAGCAGSRLACRSPDHHEIRPCPRQSGPARHLHRRRVCRWCRPVTTDWPVPISA